jgi:PIN domain nuclease of toxin-antitoxin system
MAPSLLLDTHALLWWLVEPEKLSSLALASRAWAEAADLLRIRPPSA